MHDESATPGPIDLGHYAGQQGRIRHARTTKAQRKNAKPRRESIKQIATHHCRALLRQATDLLANTQRPLEDIVGIVHQAYPVSQARLREFIYAGHHLYLEIEDAAKQSQAARTKAHKEGA
jgi:hypothetical protein